MRSYTDAQRTERCSLRGEDCNVPDVMVSVLVLYVD